MSKHKGIGHVNPHTLQEKTFSLLVISISIAIGIGPLFLLLSPSKILEADRLQIDSFITPIFITTLFGITILFRRLGIYIYRSFYQFLPLFLLWIILCLSSIFYSKSGTDASFNLSFLGAAMFYVSCKGVMEEYPQIIYKSVVAYVYTCGIASLIYILLLQTPFATISNGRYFFLGENPNSYSTRMTVSIICSIFLFNVNNRRRNIALSIFILAQLVIIFLSGSRGAIFMLGIGTLVFLTTSPKKIGKSNFRIIGLIITILLLGIAIFNSVDFGDTSMEQRLLAFFESKDTGGRVELWKDTYLIFTDHPIIGVGSEGFTREMLIRYGEYRDAHNLFLYILTTGGIIGFFFFLAFILPLTITAFKQRKRQAYSVTLVALVVFIAFKSGGVLSYSLLWFMLAISSALLTNSSRKTRKQISDSIIAVHPFT